MENTKGILLIDTHCSKKFSLAFAALNNQQTWNIETTEGIDPSIEIFEKIEKLIANFYQKHHKQNLQSKNEILAQIQEICIIKGPGSLTGLRIGSSIALGLSMGLNIPIKGISIWDLLLKEHPKSHIFFYTGTKKWMHRYNENNSQKEQILEKDEVDTLINTEISWISNNVEKFTNLLENTLENNIEYPQMIPLMLRHLELATENLNLIYNIAVF